MPVASSILNPDTQIRTVSLIFLVSHQVAAFRICVSYQWQTEQDSRKGIRVGIMDPNTRWTSVSTFADDKQKPFSAVIKKEMHRGGFQTRTPFIRVELSHWKLRTDPTWSPPASPLCSTLHPLPSPHRVSSFSVNLSAPQRSSVHFLRPVISAARHSCFSRATGPSPFYLSLRQSGCVRWRHGLGGCIQWRYGGHLWGGGFSQPGSVTVSQNTFERTFDPQQNYLQAAHVHLHSHPSMHLRIIPEPLRCPYRWWFGQFWGQRQQHEHSRKTRVFLRDTQRGHV